jgi:signal transduction histidine kinase
MPGAAPPDRSLWRTGSIGWSRSKLRDLRSWLAVGALLALCAVLGVLQYRWIGEVGVAERERLRATLRANLSRLSQDLDTEILGARLALQPGLRTPVDEPTEAEYAANYVRWKAATRHNQLLRRVAIASPRESTLVLRGLNMERGTFEPAEWPAGWRDLRDQLTSWLAGGSEARPRPPALTPDDGLLLEFPRFGRPSGPPAARPDPGRARWLIVEVNLGYVKNVILPELLRRHLGGGGGLEYQAEVTSRTSPQVVIYQSNPGHQGAMGRQADASIGLLDLARPGGIAGPPNRGRGRGSAASLGPGPDPGRSPRLGPEGSLWQLSVRHRAGSLEAVVSRARWRNLSVTAAVLMLMLATAASLIHYTRQAQRLAELQMDFVAGVSHELRTPLTVMRTAAYNLQGRLANNPDQVVRYGTMIQQECEKLTALVEQVLQFAGAKAQLTVREPARLSVDKLIGDSVQSAKAVLEQSHCVVEAKIDPDLPPIFGDPIALKRVFENLLGNAAKHGTGQDNWVGVFATRSVVPNGLAVEIRVADHGFGISPEEQKHIFEPFFRGKRALRDQIHGTGLGLSLAKQIIEGHGGTISVRSGTPHGAEFVVRIPTAQPEDQDESAHSASRG